MATKEIRICDWCESYIDCAEEDRVFFNIYINSSNDEVPQIYDAEREVCVPCAQKMIAELKLELTVDELDERAFEGFSLGRARI